MPKDRAITFRFAEEDDLDTMARIYADSFDDLQPRLSIEQYLRPRGTWALLGFIGVNAETVAAGYVITRCIADEAEIFSIGVARQYRRFGVGLALLGAMNGVAATKGAQTVYLEVGIDNRAARALYSKAGYEVVGHRPDYYRNPGGSRVTALVLRRSLENVENRDSG